MDTGLCIEFYIEFCYTVTLFAIFDHMTHSYSGELVVITLFGVNEDGFPLNLVPLEVSFSCGAFPQGVFPCHI